MTQPGSYWGTDTPISMPEPPTEDNAVIVDMGATGFGLYGMSHNINDSDLSDFIIPTFSPGGTQNG